MESVRIKVVNGRITSGSSPAGPEIQARTLPEPKTNLNL